MLLAGAFGPVLAVPGKQPPLPSDPSGTFAAVEAQPGVPVGGGVGVGVGVGVGLGVGVLLGGRVAVGVGVCDGLTVGLDEGVRVTVAVAVVTEVIVRVTVAVAVTVLVTVAPGGRGVTQIPLMRCPLPSALAAGFAVQDFWSAAVPVAALTTPTMAPTTRSTAVRAPMTARFGVITNLFLYDTGGQWPLPRPRGCTASAPTEPQTHEDTQPGPDH